MNSVYSNQSWYQVSVKLTFSVLGPNLLNKSIISGLKQKIAVLNKYKPKVNQS